MDAQTVVAVCELLLVVVALIDLWSGGATNDGRCWDNKKAGLPWKVKPA